MVDSKDPTQQRPQSEMGLDWGNNTSGNDVNSIIFLQGILRLTTPCPVGKDAPLVSQDQLLPLSKLLALPDPKSLTYDIGEWRGVGGHY